MGPPTPELEASLMSATVEGSDGFLDKNKDQLSNDGI